MSTQRINGFELIKTFYSFVFDNQNLGIKPHHISLYMFLLNQNNRNNWIEWFKCPYDLAMAGSGINSKKTYYNCLKELQEWGLINYAAGVNNWKAPQIKLVVHKCTSTVPQSEQVETPLPIQVTTPQHILLLIQAATPLPIHNIKQVTYNLKPITSNITAVINFLETVTKKKPPKKKTKSTSDPKNVARMTGIFDNFYLEKKGVKFIWQDKEFNHLKNIEGTLLQKFKESGKPLSPQNFDEAFKHLLDLAVEDNFIASKLSPSMIYSQINSIITHDGKQNTKKSAQQIVAEAEEMLRNQQ